MWRELRGNLIIIVRIMATTSNSRLRRIESEVNDVRKRIKSHADYFRGGHMRRTSALLIDPLLGSLGWDIEDPNRVQLERTVIGALIDYTLVSDKVPVAVVRAKPLYAWSEPYESNLFAQMMELRVKVGVLVSGDEWVFHQKPKLKREKLGVVSGGAWEVAVELEKRLAFWNIAPPIVRRLTGEFPEGLNPTRVTIDGIDTNLPKATWENMYAAVAKHLVATGRIRRGSQPIKRLRADNHMINSSGMHLASASHPRGKKFVAPVPIGQGLVLEANANRQDAVDNSNFLLREFGVDPSNVRVYFG